MHIEESGVQKSIAFRKHNRIQHLECIYQKMECKIFSLLGLLETVSEGLKILIYFFLKNSFVFSKIE